MPPGVAYARSHLYRGLTRLPPRRRAVLQPLVGRGTVMVTGAPPARGLLLRDLHLDHVQAWGLVRGLIEPSVQEAFRRHVGQGRVVWDLGANVGFFSLLAARMGGSVHAFEPVPENAAALSRNVLLNGYGHRITVHQVAVAAQGGRSALLVVEDQSWSHLADRGQHPHVQERVEVEVTALDDVDLPPPHFIKIDVEGSEVAVLEGGRRLLAQARPVLVIELHETNSDVCDLLDDARYWVENLDGPAPVREAGAAHILARPL